MNRRGRARAAGLLLLALLPLAPLQALTPLPAQATEPGQPRPASAELATATDLTAGFATATEGAHPVEVDLTGLEPRSLTVSDTLVLGGTLRSTGDGALERVQISLGVGARLDNRNALEAADRGVDDDPVRRVTVDDPGRNRALAAGQSAAYVVSVPVSDLRLGRLGVYPLRLQVTAVQDGRRRTVGELRTYLPWFSDTAPVPVALSVLVPMAETPTLGPGGQLLDDRLVQDVVDGGRLDRLLTGLEQDAPGPTGATGTSVTSPGETTAATVTVDPDLLVTLDALRSGAVTAPPGSASDQVGEQVDAAAAAQSFLDRLTAVTAGRATVVLPYADADVAALARDGRLGQILRAAQDARAAANRLLPRADLRVDAAWPWAGALTGTGLDALASVGARTVVLAAGEVDRSGITNYTPTARAGLTTSAGLDVTLLLADPALTDLVGRVDRAAGALATGSDPDLVDRVAAERRSPRLAEQRFLAETALIAAERPLPRTVVVTPPRHWDPDPTYLRTVLAGTERVPWLVPSTLAAAESGDLGLDEVDQLDVTPEQLDARLPSGYLRRVDQARRRLDQVRGALSEPAVLDPSEAALDRAVSAAYRDDPRTAVDLLAAVTRRVDDVVGAIRITTLGRITLTGQTGQIPVTVSNDLDQAVTVRLVARSGAPERLQISGSQQITVAPGTRLQLRLDATVRVRGVVPVTLELQTLDGMSVGPSTDLTVSATAFGRVALGVTLAAAALLMVLVGVRLLRRARRATRPGSDPTAPAEPAPDEVAP